MSDSPQLISLNLGITIFTMRATMNKIAIFALALSLSGLSLSSAAGQNFGPKFDTSRSVTVQQVLAKPTEFLAKPFTVQGKIDAVCQKKAAGCNLKPPPTNRLFA
jgi:hypothetical protein